MKNLWYGMDSRVSWRLIWRLSESQRRSCNNKIHIMDSNNAQLFDARRNMTSSMGEAGHLVQMKYKESLLTETAEIKSS